MPKLIRTYEITVDQGELDNIYAFGGSRQEALMAASQAADAGNLSGEIAVCYSFDTDEQLGTYYYIDDPSDGEVVVARMRYRVTSIINVIQ